MIFSKKSAVLKGDGFDVKFWHALWVLATLAHQGTAEVVFQGGEENTCPL